MQTTIPPQSTITLPPSAAPGTARLVIGPDLPPPLDTYVFNAYGMGPTHFVAAIVFFANDAIPPVDDIYQFIGIVDNPGLAHALVFGLVQNGAVREFSAGRPAGLTPITQGAGVTTQLNALYDDILIAQRAGSTGAIAVSCTTTLSLSGDNGIGISASGGSVGLTSAGGASTVNSDGDIVGLRNGNNNAAAGTGTKNNNVYADYPGSPAVTFTKRYTSSALLVRFAPTFFTDTANTGPEFAVQIGGTDFKITQLAGNLPINVRLQAFGERKITGIAAGSVTVTGRWRRLAGTGILNTINGDDWSSLTVQEVAA